MPAWPKPPCWASRTTSGANAPSPWWWSTPATPFPVTEAALKQHLMAYVEGGRISKFSVPASIRLVDAIARTSVGKINKRALREQYASAFSTL